MPWSTLEFLRSLGYSEKFLPCNFLFDGSFREVRSSRLVEGNNVKNFHIRVRIDFLISSVSLARNFLCHFLQNFHFLGCWYFHFGGTLDFLISSVFQLNCSLF